MLDAVHEYLLALAGIAVMALLAYSYAELSPPRAMLRMPINYMEIRRLRRVK